MDEDGQLGYAALDSNRSKVRLSSFKIPWMNSPRSYLSAKDGSLMWATQSSVVGMKDGRGAAGASESKGGQKSGVEASLANRRSSASTSMLKSIVWVRYSSIGGKSMNDGTFCSPGYGKVSGRVGGVIRSEESYKGT